MTTGTGTILDFLNKPLLGGPAHTAQGEAATHERGIGYFAPWEDPFAGFAEHSRRSVTALASTNEPVHLRSIAPSLIVSDNPAHVSIRKTMRPLLDASVASYAAEVHQFVPTEAVVARLVESRWFTGHDLKQVNRRKVAYIVLERDRVSETMAMAFNKLGQVWVTCERNRDALIYSGVHEDRIRIVELPYCLDDPLLKLRERGRPNDVPRFYHIGKWEPRKSQDKLLLAFFRAFKPREAKLTLKTGRPFFSETPGYPRNVAEAVRAALRDPAVQANGWTEEILPSSGIRIVITQVTENELMELHKWGDVYLSLSHGEGWDMPAYDAMLAGNTVVYTPSGGPERFLGFGHYEVRLATNPIPCHPCYRWESDACYWDYEVDTAVTQLRAAAARVREVSTQSPDQWRPNTLPASPESSAVGAKMMSYLREL